MRSIHPIYALVVFFVLLIILFLLFRPNKGYYWIYRKGKTANRKIIIEDILKFLFHEEEDQNLISQNTLESFLNISDDSLEEVLMDMESNSLIKRAGEVVLLLPQGRDYALRIIRIHRLYEKYLSEKTGFDKKDWHDKAEEMEHHFDEQQIEALSAKLGHPRFDPHGDPIPTMEGDITTVQGVKLSTLPINTIGRIVQIQDKPDIIYRQILAENIHIGSQVRVIESNSLRLRFYAEGEDYVLAPIVAASIIIQVFEKEEEIEKNVVRLSTLKIGEKAKVMSISRECRGEARRRLLDLGFVMGSDIEVDLLSPLSDPTAYLVKGAVIALRKQLSDKILIKKL